MVADKRCSDALASVATFSLQRSGERGYVFPNALASLATDRRVGERGDRRQTVIGSIR